MCQLGLGDIIFFKRVRVLLKEVVPVPKVIHTTTSSRYYWWKTNILVVCTEHISFQNLPFETIAAFLTPVD